MVCHEAGFDLAHFSVHIRKSDKGMYVLSRFSRVQFFVTLWTVARQVPLSMEFSRQEYWSGLPFSSPAHISNTGIKPRPPALQADSLPSGPPGKP